MTYKSIKVSGFKYACLCFVFLRSTPCTLIRGSCRAVAAWNTRCHWPAPPYIIHT